MIKAEVRVKQEEGAPTAGAGGAQVEQEEVNSDGQQANQPAADAATDDGCRPSDELEAELRASFTKKCTGTPTTAPSASISR
ncbi:unnamed protein product [Vitrella brassicaformis CCMP3155]|uniref:Uncharacterized protein n=1 Tax=Vitrella brassicaformis (strain CCMP3155) TaxID=1169540 RepID=A0A0G4EIV5_VITBC|nr:unnamed protein product [Vitrella brassicaformis CCMP3155]|mmetsp:Transcript_18223/g.51892  ORF Transcript_18223/g.51892 Transcript_18223/m.51892 type:complete len:82 (+) Transcript_18223:58-303(+)|eukprot:CEL95928.1 unnamed protein product [Vitrella brassicaformis CCMP3155]